MLGQLVLAAIKIAVLLFHTRQVELQSLTLVLQARGQIIPVLTANEFPAMWPTTSRNCTHVQPGGQCRAPTRRTRSTDPPHTSAGTSRPHRCSRKSVAQEVQRLCCMLDLPVLDVQLPQSLMAAAFRTQNLQFDFVPLNIQNLNLVHPILQATIPSSLRRC